MAESPEEIRVRLVVEGADGLAETIHAALESSDTLAEMIRQAQEKAWDEGAEAALERLHTYGAAEKAKYDNPYRREARP
jgi:hypothetical protein